VHGFPPFVYAFATRRLGSSAYFDLDSSWSIRDVRTTARISGELRRCDRAGVAGTADDPAAKLPRLDGGGRQLPTAAASLGAANQATSVVPEHGCAEHRVCKDDFGFGERQFVRLEISRKPMAVSR